MDFAARRIESHFSNPGMSDSPIRGRSMTKIDSTKNISISITEIPASDEFTPHSCRDWKHSYYTPTPSCSPVRGLLIPASSSSSVYSTDTRAPSPAGRRDWWFGAGIPRTTAATSDSEVLESSAIASAPNGCRDDKTKHKTTPLRSSLEKSSASFASSSPSSSSSSSSSGRKSVRNSIKERFGYVGYMFSLGAAAF